MDPLVHRLKELTEVRHERGCVQPKCSGISLGYGRVCTTFEVQIETLGERDPKLTQEILLFRTGFGDPAQAQFAPVGGGQNHVSAV